MSKDPVQRFSDAQNERRARGISLSHSESLRKRQGDALAEMLADSPLVKATTEEQWNAFKKFNLSDLRALRDVAREKMHEQEEEIEIWSERDDSADEGVTVFAELESRAREIWVRYMSVEVTLDSLLDYALVYMGPPPEYEKLPGGFKDAVGDRANKRTPGRQAVIEDSKTFPEVILKALLDWTGKEANLEKPFRSTKDDDSLCGYIRRRIQDHVEQQGGYGHVPSQHTIKARLRSLMESLGVELPHAHTNVLSYFEEREKIKEAVEEHGIALR